MTLPLAHEALVVAKQLARAAGDMALAGRKAGLHNVQTKSTGTDMVTEFDRASEAMIFDGLRTLRPLDSVVGEEGAAHSGTSEITWYIDPIDGTTNFLYALPNWAVSIGAADSSGPLAGVVYVPALNEMFTATRGGGAFLNDQPIHCNDIDTVSQALVCTGFSYSPDARTVQAKRVSRMIHDVRDIRRFGAASIDLCFVACGRLDAYFEENLFPWDIAAGELIAREAGCLSGDFSGGPVRPAELLVSPPKIFEPLSALITAASVASE
jgi:myo-inositol-1(or 4)-monophosphatase